MIPKININLSKVNLESTIAPSKNYRMDIKRIYQWLQ